MRNVPNSRLQLPQAFLISDARPLTAFASSGEGDFREGRLSELDMAIDADLQSQPASLNLNQANLEIVRGVMDRKCSTHLRATRRAVFR